MLDNHVVSKIGSYLSTRDCANALKVCKGFHSICWNSEKYVLKIHQNNIDTKLPRLSSILKHVQKTMPMLKKCTISFNYCTYHMILNEDVVDIASHINVLLTFEVCSEDIICSVLKRFGDNIKVKIIHDVIKGTERYLEDSRIDTLFTRINETNKMILNQPCIYKMENLVLMVSVQHLDLTPIDVHMNKKLTIYRPNTDFTCKDPWKITKLVFGIECYSFIYLIESYISDAEKEKCRLTEIRIQNNIRPPILLHMWLDMAKVIPNFVEWHIAPHSLDTLQYIDDLMKIGGVRKIKYFVASKDTYLEALLYKTLYSEYQFPLVVHDEFFEVPRDIISVQDVFDNMSVYTRKYWVMIEKLLSNPKDIMVVF